MADEFIAPSIDQHPLDQVIWGALTSRHRDIAVNSIVFGSVSPHMSRTRYLRATKPYCEMTAPALPIQGF